MTTNYVDSLIYKTRSMIARWYGRDAALYSLSCSHPVLQIVLYGDSWDKNLVIACIGPEYISGPVRWPAADIVLEKVQLKSGGEGVCLVDKKNGVRVTSESIEIKENVKL